MANLRVASSFPVSADTLWAAVPFASLADWHPMVPNITMSEDGKTRTMGFGRMTAVETLVEQGDRAYSYIVEKSPMPVADYKATWTVTPTDDGATLTIEATYEPTGPAAMSDMLLRAFFEAGFKALSAQLV